MDSTKSNNYTGNSQNLVVVVSAYNPVVTCYGSIGAPRTAGQALIDAIPTTYNQQLFAPAGVPGAEVTLPRAYYQPRAAGVLARFYAKFETTRVTAITGRWFDLWAATVAINVLCVRNGRAGRAWIDGGLMAKIDRKYLESGEIVYESSNGSSVVDAAFS